jgi:hypothetical protein
MDWVAIVGAVVVILGVLGLMALLLPRDDAP